MPFKRLAAHLKVVHARRHKMFAQLVDQGAETHADITLHLRRGRSWAERHPQPLVQPRPGANHQHASRRLINEELGVPPNGINHRMMRPTRRHGKRPHRVSRWERRHLQLLIHRAVSAHQAPQQALVVLIYNEDRSRPLWQRLFVGINLPQLAVLNELTDLIFDPEIVIRRQGIGCRATGRASGFRRNPITLSRTVGGGHPSTQNTSG